VTAPGGGAPRAVRVLGLMVFAVALVATASRWVMGGDNGEFVVVGHEGGVPHPSGFPAYVLWLRAFAWLPAASAAHRAALATCVLGVLCAALLERGLAAWGVRLAARALATSLFVLSPTAWIFSTHAEVFALNNVLAAALLLLAAPAAPLAPLARCAVVGIVVGLGLSNNLTFVLVAPLAVVAFVEAARAERRPWPAVALAAAGLALGLAPYAYLVQASAAPAGRWVWGEAATLRGLVAHLSRVEYGAPQASPTPGRQLVELVAHVGGDVLYVPLALAGYGVARLPARARSLAPSRPPLLFAGALVLALLLGGPLFAVSLDVPSEGTGRYVVERFHLLPLLLTCALAGVGIDEVLARARSPRLVLLALQALGLAAAARGLLAVRDHHRPTIERYATDSLRALPPRAVLFGSGDARLFGYLYAQRVLGVRPDVVVVSPAMWDRRWYRARVEAALGMRFEGVVVDGQERFDPRDVVARILASGREVFTNDESPMFAVVLATFPSFPVGTAIRVGPPGSRPPPLQAIARDNERAFARFEADPAPPSAADPWAVLVWGDYARPWDFLAREFEQAGDAAAAARFRAQAERWASR
jgi:hypothetical protein